MARLARVVIPGIPHHITQRGNLFSSEMMTAMLIYKLVCVPRLKNRLTSIMHKLLGLRVWWTGSTSPAGDPDE